MPGLRLDECNVKQHERRTPLIPVHHLQNGSGSRYLRQRDPEMRIVMHEQSCGTTKSNLDSDSADPPIRDYLASFAKSMSNVFGPGTSSNTRPLVSQLKNLAGTSFGKSAVADFIFVFIIIDL